MRSRLVAVASVTLTLLASAACGGDNPTDANGGGGPSPADDAGQGDPGVIEGSGRTPDAAADADLDASAPVVDSDVVDAGPAPCPTSALPTANPCVIAEAYGVFVASGAAAGGDGSRAKPFATLTAGVTAAKVANKRVYACAGTYAEALEIQNGVSMFGYFTCAANAWTVGASHARVQSPTSPAARATGITSATRIEAFDLVAPDFGALAASATQPAKSSIGLIASNAGALTLVGGTVHAGTAQRGGDGAPGATVTQFATTVGLPARGPGVVCSGLGAERTCTTYPTTDDGGPAGGLSDCRLPGAAAPNPALSGGPGGRGGHASLWDYTVVPVPGQPGQTQRLYVRQVAPGDGQPAGASAATAAGGSHGAGAAANAGAAGATRVAGANGVNATALGALTANGPATADGTAAQDGTPGQGGGGGGGYDTAGATVLAAAQVDSNERGSGATGSGGGAGGCAGVAGTAGRGGGASVSIIAIDSPLRIDATILESSNGGAAGRGGAGSSGGAGGSAGPVAQANPGGAGSAGSAGGAGGSGRGGHSIGVAYTGVMPTIVSPTYRLGAAGAGAPAFTSPTGTIPASQPGVAAQTQKF